MAGFLHIDTDSAVLEVRTGWRISTRLLGLLFIVFAMGLSLVALEMRDVVPGIAALVCFIVAIAGLTSAGTTYVLRADRDGMWAEVTVGGRLLSQAHYPRGQIEGLEPAPEREWPWSTRLRVGEPVAPDRCAIVIQLPETKVLWIGVAGLDPGVARDAVSSFIRLLGPFEQALPADAPNVRDTLDR